MKRTAWIVIGLTVCASAQAASFDCAKASTKVEHIICDNPVVSNLDDDLGMLYQELLTKTDTQQKQQLVSDQKHWLKDVRNACIDDSCYKPVNQPSLSELVKRCADDPCYKNAYQSRLSELILFRESITSRQIDGPGSTQKASSDETPSTGTTSEFTESVQKLLDIQNKQLQEIQKSAQKVLYFHSSDDKPREHDESGYCGQFWQALKDQSSFDLPQPEILAVNLKQKKKLLTALHDHAKHNFDLFMSQDGKLSPDQYLVEERKWRLGPGILETRSDPKNLPKKFDDTWHRETNYSDFFDEKSLLDSNISTSFLYLEPFPVPGYVHPVVMTLVKDKCDKCSGISMGIRVVNTDGLPGYNREALSLMGLADAQANDRKGWESYRERDSNLLMGAGMFNQKKIFWTLQKKTWDEKNNDSAFIKDNYYYYERGDLKDYFRNYEVDVYLLSDDPRYGGPPPVCSVRFN